MWPMACSSRESPSTPPCMALDADNSIYARAKDYAFSERKLLSYILVKVKPGESVQAVAQRISHDTGMAARTAEEFKRRSLMYILNNTTIVTNFGFVVVVGFVVGTAVTGQIFYNFTLDNLRYFGVFKAMGATDALLRRMIVLLALIVLLVAVISLRRVLKLEPAAVFQS